MDNISEIIGSVLSDPEAVAKLKETAKQLGLDTGGESAPAPSAAPAPSVPSSGGSSDMVAAINQLIPMLGKLQQEDDMTRLIHALKPYLSGSRLKKAEEADKIMTIMRVIPMLRQGVASPDAPSGDGK